MASIQKARDRQAASTSHKHRVTKITMNKENSDEFGGLTKTEVEMLKKVKLGKANIISCKDSNELFSKLGI